ncbi:hypothetical protein EJB05_21634, partial [Eragrostis curvula]
MNLRTETSDQDAEAINRSSDNILGHGTGSMVDIRTETSDRDAEATNRSGDNIIGQGTGSMADIDNTKMEYTVFSVEFLEPRILLHAQMDARRIRDRNCSPPSMRMGIEATRAIRASTTEDGVFGWTPPSPNKNNEADRIGERIGAMCAPGAIGSELIQLVPDDKVYDYLPQEFECTPKDKLAIEYARNSAETKVLVDINGSFVEKCHMDCLLHPNAFLIDIVFLPINIDNQHWYLAVINAKKHEHLTSTLQNDCVSCGLFLLKFIEHFSENSLTAEITQELKVYGLKIIKIDPCLRNAMNERSIVWNENLFLFWDHKIPEKVTECDSILPGYMILHFMQTWTGEETEFPESNQVDQLGIRFRFLRSLLRYEYDMNGGNLPDGIRDIVRFL